MRIHIHPETSKNIALMGVGDKKFVVLRDYKLRYVRESRGETTEITIPEGTPTDLGSIPWFVRWVISVASAPVPFAVHDYLYRFSDTSRSECDAVMLALMEYCKTPKYRWQRKIAFAGVRSGGWAAREQQPNLDSQ